MSEALRIALALIQFFGLSFIWLVITFLEHFAKDQEQAKYI